MIDNDVEVARYALRTFKVSFSSGGYLGSIAVSGRQWKDGVCEARCLADDPFLRGYYPSVRGQHEVPHQDCTCGIYGSHSLDHLASQYAEYAAQMLAVIAAEGITIIGSRGLRTQRARIIAWWGPNAEVSRVCRRECPGAREFGSIGPMLEAFGLARKGPRANRLGISEWPPGPGYWKKGE